jgi:hypothetical protein
VDAFHVGHVNGSSDAMKEPIAIVACRSGPEPAFAFFSAGVQSFAEEGSRYSSTSEVWQYEKLVKLWRARIHQQACDTDGSAIDHCCKIEGTFVSKAFDATGASSILEI